MKRKLLYGRKRSVAEWIFLIVFLAWPSFCFFWSHIVLKINSFTLAFASYDEISGNFFYNAGISNFRKVIYDLSTVPEMVTMLWRSILYNLVSILWVPIPLFVSFMIYKKCPFSKIFIVILFLPSIISSIIWVMSYKYIMDYVIPELLHLDITISLLLSKDAFIYLVVYALFMGFAGGLIIYTGAMSRIPEELIEYGHLEGLTIIQEFIFITIPLIYPTLMVVMLTWPIGVFTCDPGVFSFYGATARSETWTLGYYYFSILLSSSGVAQKINYPYASAAGLLFTVIAIPLTFAWKAFLEKLDPGVEF